MTYLLRLIAYFHTGSIKVLLFIYCTLFSFICLFAQENPHRLTDNDFPGLKIIGENNFRDKELWGYMDGGADLYFEYGFENLCVQELIFNNENFKAAIFEMSDPEAAFGIFSISHYKCKSSSSFSQFSCESKYQVQLARGRYYISVVNETGSNNAQSFGALIAGILYDKIKEKEYKLPPDFTEGEMSGYSGRLKLLKGTLAIKNGYPDWEDMIDKKEKLKIFIYENPDTCTVVFSSLIFIKNPDRLKTLFKSYGFAYRKWQDDYYFEKNGLHYYLSVCNCGEARLFIRKNKL